jgi:hypothetical protein
MFCKYFAVTKGDFETLTKTEEGNRAEPITDSPDSLNRDGPLSNDVSYWRTIGF